MDFTSTELKGYIENQDIRWTKEALLIVPEIQKTISDHVLAKLKMHFTDENEDWWYDGVQQNVRDDVVLRQQKTRSPKESNFCLIHYKDIIYKNWELFGNIYSIKNKSSDGKGKQLSWFNRLNEIRNIISHPERGNIDEEAYNFLINIQNKIFAKIEEDKL